MARKFVGGAIAGSTVALLGVGLSSAPILASASCDGTECNPSAPFDYGCPSADVDASDPCCTEGYMVDDHTWVSTAQDANWLNFPANSMIRLHLAAWTPNGYPDTTRSTVSIAFAPPQGFQNPDPDADPPDAPVGAWTNASGNDAEWVYAKPGFVEVLNGTCSPWVARIAIVFDAPEGGPLTKGPCWK